MPPISSSKWAHPNIGRCGESKIRSCQQHSGTRSVCARQRMCCCTADTTSLSMCSTEAAASKPE
jgi:hypothetical protein